MELPGPGWSVRLRRSAVLHEVHAMSRGFRLHLPGILAGLALSLLLAPAARAQVYSGQLSGGGFGGGMGGMGGGFAGARVEPDPDISSGQHVLSPGWSDDWPFELAAGETVIVDVSSETFDPMLEFLDAQDRVLATVDDSPSGDQQPVLRYRVDQPGRYRARVRASKNNAGGMYSVRVRRFLAAELAPGQQATGALGKLRRQWYRLAVGKGEILVVAPQAGFKPELTVFGPTGEVVDTTTLHDPFQLGRLIFDGVTEGEYSLRVRGRPERSDRFTLTVIRAVVGALDPAAPQRSLEPAGLHVWEIAAQAGEVLHFRSRPDGPPVRLTVRPRAASAPAEAEAEGTGRSLVPLPADPKQAGERLVLINTPGTYRVDVSQPGLLATRYTLAVSRPVRPARGEGDTEGRIGLGESDYWSIPLKQGEPLRLEGASDQFDVEVALFSPQGLELQKNDDGGEGRNARMTLRAAEAGTYLVRVHSMGDGGSGSYRLRRVVRQDRPLKAGARTESRLGAGGDEIWYFEGKKGQTVILSARSAELDPRIALYGPDNAEVEADDDGGAGTDSLLSVVLPADGRYTLWVTSKTGAGKYTVHVIEEP